MTDNDYPKHPLELVFENHKPCQADEDGLLIVRLLISQHGLSLERYKRLSGSQKEYTDLFVRSIIRNFLNLLTEYTEV